MHFKGLWAHTAKLLFQNVVPTTAPIISDPFSYTIANSGYDHSLKYFKVKKVAYYYNLLLCLQFSHFHSGPIYQAVKNATRELQPGTYSFFQVSGIVTDFVQQVFLGPKRLGSHMARRHRLG